MFGIKKQDIKTKEKKRTGTAFYRESKSSFFPFLPKKERIEKSSKQVKEEEKFAESEGLINRPYPPESFQELKENSEAFYSCVNQIATDVAGLGYKLILREGEKENPKEKEKIEILLSHPNDEMGLRQVFDLLLQDWGTIGYGAIEIVREVSGKVIELYPVRGSTIWVHKSREKYCQKVGWDNKVWFKRFGLEKDFSAKTGKEGQYSFEERANELIFFATHFGRNNFYGVPNVLPAIASVMSLREIRNYNLSFFRNYAVPAYVIVLESGKEGEGWDDDAQKIITKFMDDEIKGSDNANKTLVLKTPEGGKVTFHPLSTAEKEASFRGYLQLLEDDVLMAYSMPAYRIGKNIVGKLGGSNIKEATIVYVHSVIEPLQNTLEDIINIQIIEQGLDCHSYRFKFNDIDIRDRDADAKRYNSLIERGAMTPNEVRNLLDLGKPYTEGNRFYISSALVDIGEQELEKQDKKEMKFIVEQEKLRKEIKKIKKSE